MRTTDCDRPGVAGKLEAGVFMMLLEVAQRPLGGLVDAKRSLT